MALDRSNSSDFRQTRRISSGCFQLPLPFGFNYLKRLMFALALPSDFHIAKAPDATVTFKAICHRYIPEAIGQTERAADHFRQAADVPRDLWNWCRENFDYKEDRSGFEQIRLPRKSWADRKSGIDCEDFVILLSGILHNLRITHTVRMTDYGSGWQHIYLKIGKVTLDPVNTQFNQEPAFTRKKDHTFSFPNEALNGLSGVEQSQKWMFVNEIRRRLAEGQNPTRRQLEFLAANTYGITNKEIAKEAIELANFRHSAWLVSQSQSTQEAFERLVEAYNVQANSSLRTSSSIMLQQYSTPLPMSYLAGAFCRLDAPASEVRAFEPTAGNGFLMVATGAGKRTGSVMNELSEERRSNLLKLAEDFDFTVTNRDASEPGFYRQPKHFEAVIANPPFGEMRRRYFDNLILVNKLDQWIVLHTLTQMKDDGRGAFIIGGHTTYDKEGRINSRNQTTGDRYFFNYLYHHYNVTDVISINGELYSRQGTGFDVRMILISGRKSTPGGYAPLYKDANTTIEDSWTDLWERLRPHLAVQTPEIPEIETQYSPVKAIIRHSKTQNGIEIKFAERPPESVVSWLRNARYRWARAGHWYITYSESRWKTIQEKYGEGAAAPVADSVPTPADTMTDEQKAQQRLNTYLAARSGQADYYGLTQQAFLDKVHQLKPKGFQVKGIFIELVYDKEGRTAGGTHLPPKRKKPDEYFLVNIHDMLNKEYMAAGGIVSFAALLSNPNNRDRFRYDSELNYFIKTYPRQEQAPDYEEVVKKATEATRIKQAEVDKWNAYRKEHFKTGQILYTPKRGAILFNPVPKEQNYVQARIESLTETGFFPSRYDTIQVVIGHGYIQEVGNRFLKDLYLESPDLKPDAKNLLELYPPDKEKAPESIAVESKEAALSTTAENGDAEDKAKRLRLMKMKAKALQLRLKLLSL
jgi:predicted RNA methylase